MESSNSARTTVAARLGLGDVVSIVVGIIIGVGIYKTPAGVFDNVSSASQVMLVWVLGGIVSLIGALCFAELASAYPRSGGEYVYLTRAFGPAAGFYFAWAQLAVIRTGGMAMLAFYLAEEAAKLGGLDPSTALGLAMLAVIILTLVNTLGTEPGRYTQNLLTVLKVLSLVGIVLAGLFLVRTPPPDVAPTAPATPPSFIAAMAAVLYSYLGWNEAAYVAREVRHPQRNLPLALILGTLAVMVIYLGVNAAYLVGLGFDGARGTQAGPADIISLAFGVGGRQVITVLIVITVLGSMNAMILTGSRIFAAMGRDHAIFRPLSRWHPRWHTPIWSLALQTTWTIGLIVLVNRFWHGKDGFSVLLDCTTPVFWLFFLLTGLALCVLRHTDPHTERPFRVPLYPLTPILFCLWCGFMLVGALVSMPVESLAGLGILLAGVPVHFLSLYLSRGDEAENLAGPHEPTLRGLQESSIRPAANPDLGIRPAAESGVVPR